MSPHVSRAAFPRPREHALRLAFAAGFPEPPRWGWVLVVIACMFTLTRVLDLTTRATTGAAWACAVSGGVLAALVAYACFVDAQVARRRSATIDRALASLSDAPFAVAGARDYLTSDAAASVEHARSRACSRTSFAHRGWRDYLVSAFPCMVVVADTPIAQHTLADAVRAIDPAIVAEPVDAVTCRLALPPRRGPLPVGDPALAARVFDDVLIPLHRERGIRLLDMGGELLGR